MTTNTKRPELMTSAKTPLFKATLLSSILFFAVTNGIATAKTESVDAVKISDHIHLLRVNSTMGNTSSVISVGPDGTLLIDPNFDGSAPFIREKIKQLGGNKVDFVTSSHYHRDHTEQYPEFLTEAVGIMTEQQRIELKDAEFLKGQLAPLTFKDKTTLHLNNDTIELSTLPTKVGHTNGDLIVHFKKAGVLYVGDYLFVNGYPIVDQDVGDLEGYLANIKYMLDSFSPDTKVLAGHTTFDGAPFGAITMAEYKKYYEDLRGTIKHINAQIGLGKTQEQIVEQGLPERFAYLNSKPRFVSEKRWIGNVVKHYAK